MVPAKTKLAASTAEPRPTIRPEFYDVPERLQTYVAHVVPQSEFKIADNLRQKGMGAFLPVEPRSVRVNAVKRRVRLYPLMPGYVFPIFDEHRDVWEDIPAMDGVLKLFMSAMRPVPIPDAAVAQMREREDEARLMGRRRVRLIPFKVGSFVQVDDYGPWQGFIGQVTAALDKKQKLVISLDVFGRQTPLELSVNQVRAV